MVRDWLTRHLCGLAALQDTSDGPESILNSMAPHLGIGGCIKSSEEVAAIVE